MSHQKLNYATLLRERGYRFTPQRAMILDAVCQGEGPTTIEEIYARVQAQAPAISLATVYRTLDFFCEQRIVVSAALGSRHLVYEIVHETPHHHLLCRGCGSVTDASHELVQTLFDQIADKYRFKVAMDHLVFSGLCPACKQKDTA